MSIQDSPFSPTEETAFGSLPVESVLVKNEEWVLDGVTYGEVGQFMRMNEDGIPDFKTIYAGSNVTLTEDSNGNLIINSTASWSGTGDVVWPVSATDWVPALFDGTTGKLLKNSMPTGTGTPVLQVNPSIISPTVTTPTLSGAVSFVEATNGWQARFYEPSAGGTNFSEIRWSTRSTDIVYVLPTVDPTAGQSLTAGAPTSGVSQLSWTTVSGGGSSSYRYVIQDYKGDPILWLLWSEWIAFSQTLSRVVLECDTLPNGANLVVVLRKNSTTTNDIVTMTITTSASAVNGYYRTVTTSGFTGGTFAADDRIYAIITTKPTSGGFNPKITFYAA